jgi:hypothetical protein
MADLIDVNRRNWDERAAIHARDSTGDYMLDRFRAGEDALHAIEAAELGDISGKKSSICNAISGPVVNFGPNAIAPPCWPFMRRLPLTTAPAKLDFPMGYDKLWRPGKPRAGETANLEETR